MCLAIPGQVLDLVDDAIKPLTARRDDATVHT